MLEKRSTENEVLEDVASDPALAEQGYRFMAAFNRFFGGIRAVRRFVEAEAKQLPPGQTLKVLDIGSGSCDIPLAVSRWCRKHGRAVEFTCVDRHPVGVKAAQERIRAAADPAVIKMVKVVQADIFDYHPAEPFDCAVGSLFFHHFTDDQIVRLISHLKTFVRHSLLINDLLRYTPIYRAAWLGTAVLPPALRHDARVSIRRGFKLTELKHYGRDAGNLPVTVQRDLLFRPWL